MSKIKTSYEEYLKLKEKTVKKSYPERFKLVRDALYWFSWIGNIFSIFLAYFFVKTLFESSFSEVGTSIFITLGIIIFLSLFELLKRYIFGLFSIEYLKDKTTIFRKNMITFLMSVALIVSMSFYLSLNGAKKFVDNQKIFTTSIETNIINKEDSINKYYNTTLIDPLKKEIVIYNNRIDSLSKLNSKTYIINSAVKNIDKDKDKISKYETERDTKIAEFKKSENSKLSSTSEENQYNIFAFIAICSLIEVIIMIGVYYNAHYNSKSLEEYEKEVISTPAFKKWYRYNFILELLYDGETEPEIGSKLMSASDILELCNESNLSITKVELDKVFKLLYHLKIVKLEGNRRVYNMTFINSKNILQKYFKIL